MTKWTTWPEIADAGDLVREIITTICNCKDEFFRNTGQEALQTQLIKRVLRKLGESKGYKVWANRQLPDPEARFVNREWMYDLHWYTDEDFFLPTSLPLVVESQWEPNIEKWKIKEGEYYREEGKNIAYSGVMFDFQKLLITNATLRLMLFKVKKVEDLDYMERYFKSAIEKYPHLKDSDPFLIVAYEEGQEQIHHTLLRKVLP